MNDLLPILGISLGLTLLIEGAFAYITGIRAGKDLVLVFLDLPFFLRGAWRQSFGQRGVAE